MTAVNESRTAGTASAVYDEDVSGVYDLLYSGRGQDFAAEAAGVARTVRERRPGAASLLDVGCGTGEHLLSLSGQFDEVAGVELSPDMCALARTKLPGVEIHEDDMRTFALDRRFDTVVSMTSTLGYSTGEDELDLTVSALARHLTPGGVVVIDPWWTPDAFLDGHIAHDLVRGADRTVARITRSTRTEPGGTTVQHEAHYVVADAGGVRHFSHVQPLTLFTPEQYLGALERAGCDAEHVTLDEFVPRGLYVGTLRP